MKTKLLLPLIAIALTGCSLPSPASSSAESFSSELEPSSISSEEPEMAEVTYDEFKRRAEAADQAASEAEFPYSKIEVTGTHNRTGNSGEHHYDDIHVTYTMEEREGVTALFPDSDDQYLIDFLAPYYTFTASEFAYWFDAEGAYAYPQDKMSFSAGTRGFMAFGTYQTETENCIALEVQFNPLGYAEHIIKRVTYSFLYIDIEDQFDFTMTHTLAEAAE